MRATLTFIFFIFLNNAYGQSELSKKVEVYAGDLQALKVTQYLNFYIPNELENFNFYAYYDRKNDKIIVNMGRPSWHYSYDRAKSRLEMVKNYLEIHPTIDISRYKLILPFKSKRILIYENGRYIEK